MAKRNFLIGQAEKLSYLAPPPKMNPNTDPLYSWPEVCDRLGPQLAKVAELQENLDPALRPRGLSVTRITMHPSYIAKSYFPNSVIRALGGTSIGSKATLIKPDKWARVGEPVESPTTSLYIATPNNSIIALNNILEDLDESETLAKDLKHLWSFDVIEPQEKIKPGEIHFENHYEIGLNLLPDTDNQFIKNAFLQYADSLGFECNTDMSIEVSNLWFLPVIGVQSRLEELAKFSFVRVVRPVAALRAFRPALRSSKLLAQVELPDADPYSENTKVAILDGGLPEAHPIDRWVRSEIHSDNSVNNHKDGPSHGLGVTSAFLFGPLESGQIAPRPFSYVDHIRVLDAEIESESPYDLYRTLGHVEDVLISREYEFVNLSLGPDLPIDDDDVHPWTCVLDSHLSDGDTLLTVAAGNNGEEDDSAQLSRVQVPSDCVNAIAVGASNSTSGNWARAPYSAKGPGRSPGLVKPDVVAFGGDTKEYFHVLDEGKIPQIVPTLGTSFASPYALRSAVGIRAILGSDISPLTIKALLINSTNQLQNEENEVGWGKIPESISELIESPEGVARILYQGELKPGKYLRMPLPIPADGLKGRVSIKATCCIACPLDPKDTSMYTKAGVEIQWRPKSTGPTDGFFQQTKRANEAELRSDAGKWESVLQAEKNKLGSSLEDPEFQIHYIARDGGSNIPGSRADIIKYAFIVTIEARRHPEIFTEILASYPEILTEIQPQLSIPIKI